MTSTAPIMVPADHEGTAWLRGAIADAERRARHAQSAFFLRRDFAVVSVGQPTLPGTLEDRTCDRCRIYVAEGTVFWTFVQRRPGGIYIIGGLCDECREIECLPAS